MKNLILTSARTAEIERVTHVNTNKKDNAKYVYYFGNGKADGNESMKNLLGGKGANLAEMAGHPNLRHVNACASLDDKVRAVEAALRQLVPQLSS